MASDDDKHALFFLELGGVRRTGWRTPEGALKWGRATFGATPNLGVVKADAFEEAKGELRNEGSVSGKVWNANDLGAPVPERATSGFADESASAYKLKNANGDEILSVDLREWPPRRKVTWAKG